MLAELSSKYYCFDFQQHAWNILDERPKLNQPTVQGNDYDDSSRQAEVNSNSRKNSSQHSPMRQNRVAAQEEKSIGEKQREIDNWLTDVEIKLISLQPYASEIDTSKQIKELQNVLDNLRQHGDIIHQIIKESKRISLKASTVHSSWMQEFHSRYQQVFITYSKVDFYDFV